MPNRNVSREEKLIGLEESLENIIEGIERAMTSICNSVTMSVVGKKNCFQAGGGGSLADRSGSNRANQDEDKTLARRIAQQFAAEIAINARNGNV